MEPLPPGWRKERYSYQEALEIVGWWRYGGPRPGTDAKMSRTAQQNARQDILPFLRRDERPDQPPAPRITRRPSNWLPPLHTYPADEPWLRSGFGKPEWGFNHQTDDDFGRVNLPPPSWVALEDLESLCPGVFDERKPSGATLEQRRKPGPPPKHDWPLVVKLAVQAVKDRYYSDEPLPEPRELTARVAEQYLEAKGYDLSEKTSDLRKYCSAVLAGFRDSDMDPDA